MRYQLGMLGCLLAGCVAQPTESTPTAAAEPLAAIAPRGRALCIGLEFLPPDARFRADDGGRPEPRPRARSGPPTAPPDRGDGRRFVLEPDPSRAPALDQLRFDAIADPVARETMHFVADLVDADRQRVRREIGLPFFDFGVFDDQRRPLLTSEARLQQDHEQWVMDHGASLMHRPLRQMMRRLPFVQQVELDVADFRTEHVPLNQVYREEDGDRRQVGHLSMRLRVSHLDDPLELGYVYAGVRIATSQRRAKVSLDIDLADNLRVEFRSSSDYLSGEFGMRTDLIYRPSARMSVHVAIGDDMDFLSTSSVYSLFESPMDGSPGLLLYAVHTF